MNDLGLERWHDFYLIVGGAAAGLTGLMFVVVTLAPHVIAQRGETGVRAYVSPTVVFFTTISVVSAIMTVPVITGTVVAGLLTLGGLGGVVFIFASGAHGQWKTSDLPFRDWLGYCGVPIVAYLLLAAGGVCLGLRPAAGLSLIAVSTIVFLIVGVRNSWDLVLWMATKANEADRGAETTTGQDAT